MEKNKQISVLIENSHYGFFGESGFVDNSNGPEIDRITQKDIGGDTYFLRVRNNTKDSIKIYSFVIADFVIPKNRTIGKVMEHGWLQCSEVALKSSSEKTEQNKLFLQRDQNPLSFKTEYGYISESIISEWFTFFEIEDLVCFIGAVTTADQFAQIFIKQTENGLRVRVTSQYDGLMLKPGEVIKSEKIFFGIGIESVVKKHFAESLARHMNVKNVATPIKAMCNSYYWNGNKIDQDLINNELDAIKALPKKLNLDYFQIDAGYTEYFGDWLDYKHRFPLGFEPIVERIKEMGYKPAIWISPFAINPATKLHDHHGSWLLKGDHKKHFEGRWTSPIDTVSDTFDLEVLDPTKDEVKEYLTQVLTHFKKLGFLLFKIDFMYPLCLSEKYSKPVTRAQALREGISHIRKVLGEQCQILSCITQISPLVGLVDFVRTGIDTLNPFVCGIPGVGTMVNEYMLEKNISESEARLFLNGIVWRADPDMLIFRGDTGIKQETIKNHKDMARANNLSLWVGDSVYNMDSKTKEELVEFFNK